MAKRKHGMSMDEKRAIMQQIMQETKEVYNLKELEKLGGKAGIVVQTVKDVVQSLVDDGIIEVEKIGSGNYFWCFPSKALHAKTALVAKLRASTAADRAAIAGLERTIEEHKRDAVDAEEHASKKSRLEALQAEAKALNEKIVLHAENDPEQVKELEKKIQKSKDGCTRWTDNIFAMRTYVKKHHCIDTKTLYSQLGLPEDFDYML